MPPKNPSGSIELENHTCLMRNTCSKWLLSQCFSAKLPLLCMLILFSICFVSYSWKHIQNVILYTYPSIFVCKPSLQLVGRFPSAKDGQTPFRIPKPKSSRMHWPKAPLRWGLVDEKWLDIPWGWRFFFFFDPNILELLCGDFGKLRHKWRSSGHE